LVEALSSHRERQEEERRKIGAAWRDDRLVFASTIGTAIDARNDARAFKALLKRAGVRDVRLHDLRHTAASLLLAQGVHPRIVEPS
jgi:integrase